MRESRESFRAGGKEGETRVRTGGRGKEREAKLTKERATTAAATAAPATPELLETGKAAPVASPAPTPAEAEEEEAARVVVVG